MMNEAAKYLVTWDFSQKPSGTFYRLLNEEFGGSRPGGEFELIQRSVAICRDSATAHLIGALAERYGAEVAVYGVVEEGRFDEAAQAEARCTVARLCRGRLRRRGRKPRDRK